MEKSSLTRKPVKIDAKTYRRVKKVASTNRLTITDTIEIAVNAFEALSEAEQIRLIRNGVAVPG